MIPDIGFLELIVIMVVALLVFDHDELPIIMRKLGRGWRKLMSIKNQAVNTINDIGTEAEAKRNKITDLEGNEQIRYNVDELDELSKK